MLSKFPTIVFLNSPPVRTDFNYWKHLLLEKEIIGDLILNENKENPLTEEKKLKELQDKKNGGWFEKQRKKLMHSRHENSWVGRRRSNTPPTNKKLAGLTKRRMTDIPSLSVELYLKGNQGNGCPAPSAKDDIIFETIQHKIQDRRRSTPAVLRQCPTLSESLERLALGR